MARTKVAVYLNPGGCILGGFLLLLDTLHSQVAHTEDLPEGLRKAFAVASF